MTTLTGSLAVSLALIVAPAAGAQSVLRGRVVRTNGEVPVAGAEVLVQPNDTVLRTDGRGRFELLRPGSGKARILVRRIGFVPETRELLLTSGDTVVLELPLAEVAQSLDPVISSATRSDQSVTDAPAAVSVADSTAILAGRTVALSEVLRMMPGVVSASRHGTDETSIGIRGSGIRTSQAVRGVAVLLDGVPLTEPDGVARLDMIELAAAQQVEVVRGPVSSLYGGSSGGVVNVLTRSGRESQGIVIGARTGAYGLAKYDGWAGASLDAVSGGVLAAGSYTRTRGYRAHSESRIVRGSVRVDGEVASGTRIALEGDGSSLRSSLPGALTQLEFDDDPGAAAPLATANEFGRTDARFRIGARAKRTFPRSELTGYLYWGGRTLDLPIPGQVVDLGLHRAQGAARFLATGIADGSLELTVGLDGDVVYGTDRRWINEAGAHGAPIDDGSFSVRSLAPYLQGVWHARRDVDMTLGLRYDAVRFEFESVFPGLVPSQKSVVDQLSPRTTLSWRPGGRTSLYASVARGFEVPAIGEISPSPGAPIDTALHPKSLWSYEIGGRGYLGTSIFVDVALFYADVDGEFVPRSLDNVSVQENASRSRNVGLELALTARPASWLDAMASYTLSDLKLLDYRSTVIDASGLLVDVDYSGKLLPGVPRHRLTGMLRARPVRRLDLGVQSEWQSVVYVESANEKSGIMYVGAPGATPVAVPFRAIPARLLVGFDASWTTGFVTLLAGAENLGGVRYSGSVIVNELSGRFYEPGPGRAFFAGVRIGVTPGRSAGER